MPEVAFDLDGTLIYEIGEKEDTPRYDVIELFRLFEKFGCDMYIWSQGGEDYAEQWVKKLGLKAKIVPKGSFVPNISVDNELTYLGEVNIIV